VMISVTVSAEPLLKAGRIRALAVTGAIRSPGLPDIPTIAESGVPNYGFSTWYGIQVPAQVPPAIVAQINADVVRVLEAPDVRARMTSVGVQPMSSSAAEFGAMVQSEIAKWAKVVDRIGLEAN
jgi:tripartite-type tricarboxylate transporter receptor subunit TctC